MLLKVGAASKIVNCKVGDAVAGMLEPRISTRVRDDLEANAFYVTDGEEQALIINCDLVSLAADFVEMVAGKIEARTGLPAINVIICATHTHSGPYTGNSEWGSRNGEYMQLLASRLVEVAEESLGNAVPAKVAYALGKAHIGYNRRVCWADGSHSMYGNTLDENFAGIEGPDDSSHAVLFAVNEADEIIAVMHNNTCHATSGCSWTDISADFPGEARSIIRRALVKDLPVLYLQGTCGDVCRFNQLEQNSREPGRRLKEIGTLLAGETLRLIRKTPVREVTVLKHLFRSIEVGIRMPSDEMLANARKVVEEGKKESNTTGNIGGGYGFQKGILRLHDEYKDNPYERVPLHAVRIGGFAITTVPCELYCQFGLDIKRRSPAEVTAVSELTHGALGYCPTAYGILGGGYSGATYYGSKLEPFAGYKMVEELSKMLYEMF